MKLWSVRVYGFEGRPYDPVVERPTASAARYAAFKAAREAGYFQGRDGFFDFIINSRVWPATEAAAQNAPRIERARPAGDQT